MGEEILKPTKIYSKTVSLLKDINIHGMAHITGGGFLENLPRILPEGLEVRIYKESWDIPPIFSIIQKIGQVEDREMYMTFNMGIGYALVVPEELVDDIIKTLSKQGEKAWVIGKVTQGNRGVVFCQS